MSEINPEKLDRKAEYEKAKAEKAAKKEQEKNEKASRSSTSRAEKNSRTSDRKSSKDGSSASGSLGLENRREIPTSTYDLLNNRFGDSNRARFVLIIFYIIALTIYAAIIISGLTTRISINEVDNDMKMLASSKQKLLSQFGSSTGLKGVSETDLIDRAKVVSDATKAVITKQADAATIVNEIKGKDIPGMTISSIDITRADLKVSPNDPKTKDPKYMATQASAYIVTVVATGKDFASIVSWSDAIRSIPVFYNVSFSRNGFKITLTASVKNAMPAGGATLLSSFGIASESAGNQSAQQAQRTQPLPGATASNNQQASPAPVTPTQNNQGDNQTTQGGNNQ